MTRVNLVPPRELHAKHLVAEYRELPRIFGCVRRAQERGDTPRTIRAPLIYTLGKGHMKFFYTRLAWLVRRQELLIEEMRRRGYNPRHTDPQSLITGLHRHWLNDWQPDTLEIAVSCYRINERLQQMRKP